MFVAIHPDRGRVDATLDDLGCGWAWPQIHRRRPRVPLRCQQCQHPVHAKLSAGGLRFFAHDAERRPDCPAARETMEHHLLKLELATAVRSAGWQAELEATGPYGDWRADVLAVSPDGARTMAWEAQLSSITAEQAVERTDRFTAAGIPVCWVTVGQHPWSSAVPAIVVRPPIDRGHVWQVTQGLFRFDDTWLLAETDLVSFVSWVLTGRVVYYDDVLRRVWTAPHYAHLAAQTQDERVRQWRIEARRAAEHAAWVEGARQRAAAAQREAEAADTSGLQGSQVSHARAMQIRNTLDR
ncbi:competence protein CoiA family protein [Actinoplanes sp. NPDC023801]|uniref:competence protein CoiA n=1 Tax=Actinoplanes sp. NPDC023801 TaxID=3154595 RepID=UPI0033E2C39C